MTEPVILAEQVEHFYGRGALRTQILHSVSTEVQPGEIVILTGPSGSGKTTFLTLVGALRTVQEGRLRVLGHELRGASDALARRVRRDIGFIFQQHNLLGSLSALENVEMSLRLHPHVRDRRRLAVAALESVGMAERLHHGPRQLSGGQRQRVAIARALASRPRLVLADEPTASLDKRAGRDVVDLLQGLAKEAGTAVLLVTHDSRILDIADRIINLEDGRLTSFARSVVAQLGTVAGAQEARTRLSRVDSLSLPEFLDVLGQTTREYAGILETLERVETRAWGSILDELLSVFPRKVAALVRADRVSVFVRDAARGELWTPAAQGGQRPVQIRIPERTGVVGHVIATGKTESIPDAYADPRFNRTVDEQTGYRTRTILCVPVHDRQGGTIAAVQLINRLDGAPFDARDAEQAETLAAGLGVILEGWLALPSGGRSPVPV